LRNSNRTCSIYVGLGSSVNNTFRIIEYSYKEFNVYDDTNWHFDENHPKMENMLWKEYRSGTPCFKNILTPAYGNITAETMYRKLAGFGQTGDSQVVVMDFKNNFIYISYPNPITFDPSYVRPILRVNMNRFYDPKILEDTLWSNQITSYKSN